ncbi:MAG: DUF3306 domain-containing protein, partial [Burkholderiaceae bacterium]|nr:DUF3306 domain-containing protein [Burkholderiaceae bacterium]
MADGFLGRWSRRKQDARVGKPLDEPAPAPGAAPLAVPPAPGPGPVLAPQGQVQDTPAPVAPPPALTLADAQALTPASDFTPFVARNVAPEVRNQALKTLFTDPHFNVMDGLDIYIDDYSRPDPLPAALLRQMASAQFLGFFSDEPAPAAPTDPLPLRDTLGPAVLPGAPDGVAQSGSPDVPPTTHPSCQDHDHADLRL